MLHALPTPWKGATHIDVTEASFSSGGFGHVRGTVGTANAEGTALDPELPQWPAAAAIQGAHFAEYVAREGEPSTTNPVLAALSDLAAFTLGKGLWR